MRLTKILKPLKNIKQTSVYKKLNQKYTAFHNNPLIFTLKFILPVFMLNTIIGLYRAILSIVASDLQFNILYGDLILASLSLGLFGFAKAFAALYVSRIPKMKTKYLLFIAGGSASIGAGFIFYTNQASLFLLGSVFMGIAFGAGVLAITVMFTSIIGTKGRGTRAAFVELSAYLGISFGAFLLAFSYQQKSNLILFYIMLAFLSFYFLESFLLKDRTPKQKSIPFTKFFKKAKSYSLAPLLNGSFTARLIDTIILVLFPIALLEQNLLTPYEVTTAIGMYSLTWALSMSLSGRLGDKFGRQFFLVSGLLIQALGLFLLYSASTTISYYFSATLVGLGTGTYYPSLQAGVIDVAGPHRAQGFASVFRGMQDMNYVISITLILFVAYVVLPTSGVFSIYSFFLIIAILQVIFALLLFMFYYKETNPIWSILPQIQQHTELIYTLVKEAEELTEELVKHPMEKSITEVIARLKVYEEKADAIVLQIKQATAHIVFRSDDATHFLNFIQLTDKGAGEIIRGLRFISWLPKEKRLHIYPLILTQLRYLHQIVTLLYQLSQALETDLYKTFDLIKEVETIESKLDKIYQDEMKNLLKNDIALEASTFFIYQNSLWRLEKASNIFEDASEEITYLVKKYLS